MPIWALQEPHGARAQPAMGSSVPAPRDVTTEPADTLICLCILKAFLWRCDRASLRAPLPSAGSRAAQRTPAGTGQPALRWAGENYPLLFASQ